jgi:catechol 2,3-dioxygenase-like lactoylglutathione lyase family enzyme
LTTSRRRRSVYRTTAIVVSDTARSVRFYRDVLGMRVAGESDNHGPEQERLSNVRGAHLRITTLRAATGPGVELLEYVAPTDGRASAGEMRATDLAAGRTIGTSSAPRALLGELTTAGVAAERRQLLLRDPDGHLVHVRSR